MDFPSIAQFLSDHALDAVGLALGLCYLYFEYHANALVWLFSLLMPMVSMVVYYRSGLYADFSINIYYLLASAYGLMHWRGTRKKAPAPITYARAGVMAGCAACVMVLWGAIWWLLSTFTDSTVPVADAFTTSLSIVGTWMLARKYIQQWWAWAVVDAVCVPLYIYKGIPFYAVLYAVYTAVAFLGFAKWRRLMRSQSSEQ